MVDARDYHDATIHRPGRPGGSSTAMDPALRPRPWKQYRDLDHISLPEIYRIRQPTLSLITERSAEPRLDPDAEPAWPLTRKTIASLCFVANGITQTVGTDRGETVQFRAASCTGRLYHIDLYLAVGSDCDLPAGLYHFDPRQMRLDVLREGDVRHEVARAAGNEDRTDDAPLVVIATSQWWRNAWKYTERAYRHAFWDTGTIIANLLAAAQAFANRAAVVTAFDDDTITSLLGIDPENEAPVALIPIGAGDSVDEEREIEPIAPDTEPVSSEVIDYPMIVDAWEQSRLEDGETASVWRETVAERVPFGSVALGDADRFHLAPVDDEIASSRPLNHTIRRRGSCREFSEAGPSVRMVGTVLDRALRGIPGDWNHGHADGHSFLSTYLLIDGVDGIPTGTYQYDRHGATIERVGSADGHVMERLALDQPWAGEAHVNVYLMANIDRIVDSIGNRGYRLAQLEAGITLGRLYLATYAHRRLGGTGLTFYDELVTDHLSPRAEGQTPMCLFAFGRRADR